jgi:hypothetical protein
MTSIKQVRGAFGSMWRSVALLVLVLFLSGSICCGDDDDNPLEPAAYDITGTWYGSWSSNEPGYSGELYADFTQDDNDFTGEVMLTDSDCFSYGTISGTISGDEMTYSFRVGSQTLIQKAGTFTDENHVSGTYEVVAGDCTGDEGTWELTRG